MQVTVARPLAKVPGRAALTACGNGTNRPPLRVLRPYLHATMCP